MSRLVLPDSHIAIFGCKTCSEYSKLGLGSCKFLICLFFQQNPGLQKQLHDLQSQITSLSEQQVSGIKREQSFLLLLTSLLIFQPTPSSPLLSLDFDAKAEFIAPCWQSESKQGRLFGRQCIITCCEFRCVVAESSQLWFRFLALSKFWSDVSNSAQETCCTFLDVTKKKELKTEMP